MKGSLLSAPDEPAPAEFTSVRIDRLSHLSDSTLRHDLKAAVTRNCASTAEVIAHIAEFDTRKLYVTDGYPSMFAYCLGELHLTEDAAYRRIQAARSARRFPALFAAVAEGRLHLTAVCLLAPHLTPENVDELIEAATHRGKTEIQEILARRFPQPDLPTKLRAISSRSPRGTGELGPAQVEVHAVATLGELGAGQVGVPATAALGELGPAQVEVPAKATSEELGPAQVETPRLRPTPRPKVTPLSPGRFAFQATIDQEMRDMLRYAQQLLSHSQPGADEVQVLKRALREMIQGLEKRKFAATTKPRQAPQSSQQPRARRTSTERNRYIPAHVRRAVRERDRGQCTFVSTSGHRCGAREFLEFDHIDPVARGGRAKVETIRLRCRAHNQFEAEYVFGTAFMDAKRDAARHVAVGG